MESQFMYSHAYKCQNKMITINEPRASIKATARRPCAGRKFENSAGHPAAVRLERSALLDVSLLPSRGRACSSSTPTLAPISPHDAVQHPRSSNIATVAVAMGSSSSSTGVPPWLRGHHHGLIRRTPSLEHCHAGCSSRRT